MADYPGAYGLVHARLYAAVGDTVDAGRAPDRIGLNGTVTFSANGIEKIVSTTPGSEAFDLPQKITAQVTNGALQWLGTDDVPLIANLDASGNTLGWQWRVDFSLTFTDPTTNAASRVTLTGWTFDVKVYNPAAALVNGQNPTITQLTTQAPVTPPNTALLAKGDPGPAPTLTVRNVTTTTDPAAAAVTFVPTGTAGSYWVDYVLLVSAGGGGGGAGTVTKVAGVAPDGTGNVTLSPALIGAATAGDVVTAQQTASNALTAATNAQSAANAAQSAAGTAQAIANGAVASQANLAPLASPTFTGTPKAPTPATATNDTTVATTAAVRAMIAAYAPASSAVSNIVVWNATTQTWTQNGLTITARPTVTGPILLLSTNDALATRPSWMAIGDSWIQHPDAVA